jgi:tRNA A37 threonylcarbamoyladenosine modification protein TsaB
MFATELELFKVNINIMKSLIIDAVGKKIFLVIINNKNIYTNSYDNSKSNYDKLIILINTFLEKNKISINNINKIYVNRGPGSFAGIRNSLSIVKGIHLSKNIDYYCFSYLDFLEKKTIDLKKPMKWEDLPNLCNKFKIRKNLIKPVYLS